MHLLSIDWFSLSMGGEYINTNIYQFKRLSYSTRIFKIVEEISFRDQLLFTIARQPNSPILPGDFHSVKWDNKYLYQPNAIIEGLNHLHALGLKIKSLSRLDLAIDFNTFKYGLLPNTFINKFMKGIYVHNGRSKFKVIGIQDSLNKFEYFRFGSNKSRCAIYLYNKTLEMQQVRFKQHIHNKWKLCGLDIKNDVWRLEVSLQTGKLDLVDKSTGENIKFDAVKCNDSEYLRLLFQTTISHYFHFKHKSKQKNKDRWKNVDLLMDISYDKRINFRTDLHDHDRSDKIYLKKMYAHYQETRNNNLELSTYMWESLQGFVRSRGLGEYFTKKVSMNE